ncbi:hypothetical protein NQ318_017110, partial [Aromia moschata]
MPIDLYGMPASAPCRAVLLAAKAVGVEVNFKEINVRKGEHLTPDMGRTTAYIRRTLKKRAIVDQRLYFDIGTLYARFGEYFYPLLNGGSPDPAKLEKLNEALTFLDTFLAGSKYAAGDNLTLADLTLVANLATIEGIGVDITPYENITKWYDTIKTNAPGYEEINGKNLLAVLFKPFIDQFPSIFEGASLDPAKLEKLKEALNFLDSFLANSKYAAGDSLTLADLSLVASVSTL